MTYNIQVATPKVRSLSGLKVKTCFCNYMYVKLPVKVKIIKLYGKVKHYVKICQI